MDKLEMSKFSYEEQLERIRRDGVLLRYVEVENKTVEMCLEAVKENSYALRYIKEPTNELCLEAVRNNGYALQYINNPTEEMCLEAVKNSGDALAYIKNPTEEVCMEAVKKYGQALRYVKNPTKKTCLEAVKQSGYALQYVPLEFLKDDLTEIDYSNPLDNLKFNKQILTVSEIEGILGYKIQIVDKVDKK